MLKVLGQLFHVLQSMWDLVLLCPPQGQHQAAISTEMRGVTSSQGWDKAAWRHGRGLQFTGPVYCSSLQYYVLMTAACTSREHVPLLFTQSAVSLLKCTARDGFCHTFLHKTSWDGKWEVKIFVFFRSHLFMQAVYGKTI